MRAAALPEIPVGEGDETCAYCRRPDGSTVMRARHSVEKAYKINGEPFTFRFLLCDLCQFARRIFPHWDAMNQSALIKLTVEKLRDRYA